MNSHFQIYIRLFFSVMFQAIRFTSDAYDLFFAVTSYVSSISIIALGKSFALNMQFELANTIAANLNLS